MMHGTGSHVYNSDRPRFHADGFIQQHRLHSIEPIRAALKCIVDDTAFILGLKKSTRDGLRKWVSMSAIQLFIPLYSKSNATYYPQIFEW
jgi:hypothetical protein